MRPELTTRPRSDRSRTRSRARRPIALTFVALGLLVGARESHAQTSTVSKPMANVLLLVDTSGSMERMPNNSLPSENKGPEGSLSNVCNPGYESNPNRWGMLLQALTGNMLPHYSCAAMDRTSAAFRNEYKINGVNPYDSDYALPYHRPLTGIASGATGTTKVCAIGPRRLPGADDGQGVGPGVRGYAAAAGFGGDVTDFPDDALQSANWTHLQSRYGSNQQLANPLGAEECLFSQAPDGQLDAARDYVRFALMTFDNDTANETGVMGDAWPPVGKIRTGGGHPFLGQWSYRRDSSNDYSSELFNYSGSSRGRPDNCVDPALLPFEVGARHWGAPPWEGRMVPFPAVDASLLDIQRTNEQIQRVLLATRPFGATPIDGMMDDARDYFWWNAIGPKTDPYVATGGCRDEYIILLTDGAPNLNMRKQCETGTGVCPFKRTAAGTAAELYNDTAKRVTTFVIGFSVNGSGTVTGDGFPGDVLDSEKNCKGWYTKLGGTPKAMADKCIASPPPAGTTAEACCALNEVAFAGSGGAAVPDALGPFFAESQADIALSFGKILAAITKRVSTRTVPTYTPAAYSSAAFGTGSVTAQYLASFIPNAQKPWSGEIVRERSRCEGTPLLPKPITPPSLTNGDSMATNLARQGAARRLFITAVPDGYTTTGTFGTPPANVVVDAARTVRPFYATTTLHPADGIAAQSAKEYGATDWGLKDAPTPNSVDFRRALDIEKSTCRRGKAINSSGNGTRSVPALDKDNGEACTNVVMGFVTAHPGQINETGHIEGGVEQTYDFNVRCTGSATSGESSAGKGICSISATSCTVSDAAPCPKVGEVCVPLCSALGAIFRANPVVNGPPDAVLRDDGYRAFQGRRANRKPVLYAASTDGILHAFKAVEQASGADHELWSFIPPAVLPRLASNYPAGNQILLDGTPVVRDNIWERGAGDVNSSGAGYFWHTTLVAGLGVEGGGYYAVNVTDSDCNSPASSTTSECTRSDGYEQPLTQGSLDQAGRAPYDVADGAKRGPHFLWQLTDIPSVGASGNRGKISRKTKDGVDMYALFGRQTGTPAITTVTIKSGATERQVGVAILPGGIDGPPLAGLTCPRIGTATDWVSETPPRENVRRWAQNCTGPGSAVPGRGLTIVRLDNGHVIRHFGRLDDIPAGLSTSVIKVSPFDSPVIGTPVVYPQTIGAVAQKIFVGDADGALWRVDVSSSDPANWKVELFHDLVAVRDADGVLLTGANESQPVSIPPVISLDANGALIINAATGDQESITYRANHTNYVWSLREERPVAGASTSKSKINWYQALTNGHRVTGPMTVFDRTLYFASFAPRNPSSAGSCTDAGEARLWGVDYVIPKNGASNGGAARWCTAVTASGACDTSSGGLEQSVVSADAAGSIISGVTLRASQSCATIDASTSELGGTGFSALTPMEYHLSFGIAKPRTGNGSAPPSATLASVRRPLPRVATTVNAWALVVD